MLSLPGLAPPLWVVNPQPSGWVSFDPPEKIVSTAFGSMLVARQPIGAFTLTEPGGGFGHALLGALRSCQSISGWPSATVASPVVTPLGYAPPMSPFWLGIAELQCQAAGGD